MLLNPTVMNNAIVGIMKGHEKAQALLSRLEEVGIRIDDDLVLVAPANSQQAPPSSFVRKGLIGDIVDVATAGLDALIHPERDRGGEAPPSVDGAPSSDVYGCLVELGVPQTTARHYDTKVRRNELVVAVHVEDAESSRTVLEALKKVGAHDVTCVPELEANDTMPDVA
jgi:hypothetical protein